MIRTVSTIDARIQACTATTGRVEIVVVTIGSTRATMQLSGAVDHVTVGLVAAALRDQLAQGHRFVRLDLSRLTLLDRAGLRVLVDAHNEYLYASGALVLTGVDHCVMPLLRLTHLDEALFIAGSPGGPEPVTVGATPSRSLSLVPALLHG